MPKVGCCYFRGFATGVSRYDAWHGVNDAIASVALKAQPAQDGEEGRNGEVEQNGEAERGGEKGAGAVKGAAIYVVLNRATGKVEWRFQK